MKPDTPRAATDAMKSVVVVSDKKIEGDYCSGFIAVKTKTVAGIRSTLVVAPSQFVRGRKHLNVCFFDGVQSRASIVTEEGAFCLLTTIAHSACVAITWMESTQSLLTPCPTFMLPPYSNSRTYYQPTYAALESVESYLLYDYRSLMVGSQNYFLVSCDYTRDTFSGVSRLIASPVFVVMGNGKTRSNRLALGIGVVLQDCSPGNEMKVAVTAAHFKEIMKILDPPLSPPIISPPSPSPPRSPPSPPRRKRRRKRRKRDEQSRERRKRRKQG